MRFDIMTLFPELVDRVLSESIIGRARSSGIIEVNCFNIRDWSEDRNRRVDDTPYGGGKGMLMAAPPVFRCFEAVRDSSDIPAHTVYMSPKGRLLSQPDVVRLSGYGRIIILCGHYEGVDQRVVDEICDEEISVGDYVVTGGELPACILADAVSRLVPGVLSSSECFERESHFDGLLEYAQYTRPYSFRGVDVPEVLISGNHAKIEEWRRLSSLETTKRQRPDLYEKYLKGGAGNGQSTE